MNGSFEFVVKYVVGLVAVVTVNLSVFIAFGAVGYPLSIDGMGREFWYGAICALNAMSVARLLKI